MYGLNFEEVCEYFLLSFRQNDYRLMMGPTRRRKSTSQYDPDLYENWTMVRLKEELRNRGIRFPINAKRMVLVRLLKNNETTNDSHVNNVNGQQSQSSTLGDLTQQQFLPHDIDSYAQVNSSLLSSARSHDSAGAGGVANTREDNAEMEARDPMMPHT